MVVEHLFSYTWFLFYYLSFQGNVQTNYVKPHNFVLWCSGKIQTCLCFNICASMGFVWLMLYFNGEFQDFWMLGWLVHLREHHFVAIFICIRSIREFHLLRSLSHISSHKFISFNRKSTIKVLPYKWSKCFPLRWYSELFRL